MSDLLDTDVTRHMTTEDDIYLVHRRSLVGPEALEAYFRAVSALIRGHADAPRYLVDVSGADAHRLTRNELDAIADPGEIVAGFRTPERSVDTRWVADRLHDALCAEPRIGLRMGVAVTGVRPLDAADGPWCVAGEPGVSEPFDLVVNALWDGRLAVDLTAGLAPEGAWSHRYRLCVFIRTRKRLGTRSCIVAVGAFGDVKNYDGREFYLSWYPVGLVAESEAVAMAEPAPLSAAGQECFVARVRDRLAALMPPTAEIFDLAESVAVGGGFVFAQGRGSIADPASTLHRRDRFGVRRLGRYVSIDTGKYSTAPWLADKLTRELCGD
jgi:hypothetical protein